MALILCPAAASAVRDKNNPAVAKNKLRLCAFNKNLSLNKAELYLYVGVR